MADNPIIEALPKGKRRKFANEAERLEWMRETIARWNLDMARNDIRWIIRGDNFALEYK